MFAIVRTGGKQYRVAAGDKIAVEKLPGNAGDTVSLDDVLLAGDGGEVKDAKGLVVSAEIIAQERGDARFINGYFHRIEPAAGFIGNLAGLLFAADADVTTEP